MHHDGIIGRYQWGDGASPILGIARNEARQNRLVLCGTDDIPALQGPSRCPGLRGRIKEDLALCVWEHHGADVAAGKHRPTTIRDASLHRTESISDTRDRCDRGNVNLNIRCFKLRLCKRDAANDR